MKTWVDEELIDDGDMNYIGTRLVQRYPSTASRGINIPSPIDGQLAYVTGVGLTLWHGAAWATLVPAGGTTGQVLTKASDADFDLEWTTP